MSPDPANAVRLDFLADPAVFLAVAGDHLAADPVVSTVVTTIAHRARGREPDPDWTWWLVVRDGAGEVVGAAMRTAPFDPYPPFLLPMPDGAAVALARALHERGEEVRGINGALPTVDLCARELARLRGGWIEVAQRTRLHELGALVPPTPVPGRLARVDEDCVDLATEWFAAFMGDADEQAGRPRGVSAHEVPDRSEVARLGRNGELWFWEDASGTPVHLTGAHPPSFGVSRIGPVYTPPPERGKGYASNAVAEVSRRIVAGGARACLYTDQANPRSNAIYAALGYRPVTDMANLLLRP